MTLFVKISTKKRVLQKNFHRKENATEKIRQAKFEINLADYAERQGYEVNKQKSTATDVILQKQINQGNSDTIGVRYYPETGYKYWTAMDSSDRGSLLDFEKNKNHLDLASADGKRELYQKIDAFLGNPQNNQAVKIKPISKKAESEKRLTDRELNLLPLTDTRYLEGRGITEKTYRSPEFQCQVYNEKVILSHKTYVNTVFPIRNEEILLAKIRRNDEELGYRGGQFNKIQEKRENGIHTSNFPKQPLDKLYLIESPIDAMSYFELKYDEIRAKNTQVAFISTIGNPSNSAYNTIQKFINAAEPKQVISLMDNDRAGAERRPKVFTINLIGRLSKPENDLSNNTGGVPLKAEINVSQKTEATLSINFSFDTDKKRRAMAITLKEKLLDPLKNNISEGSEAAIKVLTITKSSHNAHIEIKFPYDNANLSTVERGLIQLKGLENEFCLEHPNQKDWNDELKRQKPFVVTVEKQGVELPKKRFSQGVEAFTYAQYLSLEQMGGTPQQDVKLYLEKYNRSHEVDKPQVFAIIKQGEIVEINPILKQEVEKQQRDFLVQRTLQEEKLLALQLSKELFPTNECVIIKTTHQANTQQHFIEFQKVQSDEKLQNFAGINTNFQEKINISDSQNFVITFNKATNSTHLMIPNLKESTEIEKSFVEKNKGYLTEKSVYQKEEMLKKNRAANRLESQCGELLISDKQGAIIATADYNISIENGKPIVHKIENFEFEKISCEGLDIGVIRKDLVESSEGLSQNKITDELVFIHQNSENELGM